MNNLIRGENNSIVLYFLLILFSFGLMGCGSFYYFLFIDSEDPKPILEQKVSNPAPPQAAGSLKNFKNNRGVLNSEIELEFCEGGSQNNCTDVVKSLMNPNDRIGINYGSCEHGKNYNVAGTKKIIKCMKKLPPQSSSSTNKNPEIIRKLKK